MNQPQPNLPEFAQWINPVLAALRELGGSGRPQEVIERVAKDEEVSDAILDQQNQTGGPRFANQVHWARYFLAESGLIDRTRRGVWALTELGTSAGRLSPAELRALVSEVHGRSRGQRPRGTGAREASVGDLRQTQESESPLHLSIESAPPDSGSGGYRARLTDILGSLSPSGFERLCQRLLREAGFEQVTVTGRSNDGGIDGHGVLSLNAFVSFRVLFQCKRYTGTVSPAQVRDFRGAMQGRADKGIILTTGSFTAEARREASRDGAPPIELVDGEKLIDLFAELELGLRPVTTFDVDERFFEEYS